MSKVVNVGATQVAIRSEGASPARDSSKSSKRVFVAPARAELNTAVFDHPVFDQFREFREWKRAEHWPSVDELNQRAQDVASVGGPSGPGQRLTHSYSAKPLCFVEQTDNLLADDLHYEQRIYTRGEIPTRTHNWHDLFNAMIWLHYPALKSALNARQWQDVQQVGPKVRTPSQCAMTLFDEAGALVWMDDPAMRECWRTHDWHGLFIRHAEQWQSGAARVLIFGHALLEHALVTEMLLVAKCIVLSSTDYDASPSAIAKLADEIAAGKRLQANRELRTLPLAGIPGWHTAQDSEHFVRTGKCFSPPPKILRDF
jgi:hypothetical protein